MWFNISRGLGMVVILGMLVGIFLVMLVGMGDIF
jgi:hypothetical protein